MRKLLYSNGSPFARRVRIVLAEKRIEFDSDVLDALRPIDQIRPHNPVLQVPVFYDNERTLWGSNLIVEYLFASYPTPSGAEVEVPLSPTITRDDRQWDDKLILATIESLADSIVNVRLMKTGADASAIPFLDRQLTRVASCLDWLEGQVFDDGFWPGTFSILDINLMCPLLYGQERDVFDFRSGRWPKIAAMVDRWQSRPSVAATPVVVK